MNIIECIHEINHRQSDSVTQISARIGKNIIYPIQSFRFVGHVRLGLHLRDLGGNMWIYSCLFLAYFLLYYDQFYVLDCLVGIVLFFSLKMLPLTRNKSCAVGAFTIM